MKAFDPDYKLLDEMYQDDYYPAFLVDRVKDELQKVIDLLESGETPGHPVFPGPVPIPQGHLCHPEKIGRAHV